MTFCARPMTPGSQVDNWPYLIYLAGTYNQNFTIYAKQMAGASVVAYKKVLFEKLRVIFNTFKSWVQPHGAEYLALQLHSKSSRQV